MRLRPRQGLLVGVAVLAAASVVLGIALERLWAPLFGPHVALAAPGLALAGAGLGGALAAALPGIVPRPALFARATLLSGLAAAGTLAAILVSVHVKLPDGAEHVAEPAAAIVLTALLPFLAAGIVIAAAVQHVHILTGRIVFAVFAGAALGAPLSLAVMRLGAPRACLSVIIVFALASLVFYLGAKGADAAVVRPRGALVATFLLASFVLLAGDVGAPWLKLPSLRFHGLDKIEVQEWSGLGLLTLDKAVGGINWIRTDGLAAQPLYDGKTAIPVAPDEMAFVLQHADGPVAVVGGGGGREVRIALKYGQRDIHAIELDPILVRTILLDRYKKASGDVYDSPSVKVALEDARGYLRRSHLAFRNIDIAMTDEVPALGVGALAASPTPLFTVEAMGDFLAALAPEGTLVAARSDAEGDHLLALMTVALERDGAADAGQHLYACSASRATTVLARKTPLGASDVAQLRNFCKKNKMLEVFAPDARERQRHTSPEAQAAEAALDMRPPVDDRPFFASVVPAGLFVRTLSKLATRANAQGLVALAAQFFAGLVFLFFAVGLPLAAAPRSQVPRGRALVFFGAVGASLGLAATSLLPRLGVLLGHPIYGSTTCVPTLMASIAVGGLVVGRVRASGAETSLRRRAELLVGMLALTAICLGPVVEATLGLPFAARFAAALLFLVPVGLLGGSLLALGARLCGAMSPSLVAWSWGMAGIGAFVAGTVAMPVAITVGYGAVLLVAGGSALVAALCVPRFG
jgi:hypothetical protein